MLGRILPKGSKEVLLFFSSNFQIYVFFGKIISKSTLTQTATYLSKDCTQTLHMLPKIFRLQRLVLIPATGYNPIE